MASSFERSKLLNNIPNKKVKFAIEEIEKEDISPSEKRIKNQAINRFAESNIPIEYWDFKMEKDFVGDENLLKLYNDYIFNIKENYIKGKSFCLAGQHGRGKTATNCSILKFACLKGYSCTYTTLSDIVNCLTYGLGEEKSITRKELLLTDFLFIDEFDPRFIGSDQAADLFARTLENIFRTRMQNKSPTLMCTNSPNVLSTFHGSFKDSLESLIKGYLEIIPVYGEDFRKRNK